ncbi:CotH kinase family protein [uncultured Draconibacterium sp.]|uniref:CotH kinase family protein n=1 Tax=uncultured Draconibacterium sp. TaxID=1573823 RepID=UPI0025EE4E32|nr:CotH kinase family protein [uncultured Draconibacterium sp.]
MKKISLFTTTLLLLIFAACRDENLVTEVEEEEEEEQEIVDMTDYSDWDDATHSSAATLNYDMVFNQSEVLRFDITIDSDDWTSMQSNLSSILSSGSSRPGESLDFDDPSFYPCSFKFNDTEWYHVGIRYKGNSSLQSTYRSGLKKFSFKLDFDEFEDDYPAIKNQRFYGFKQLNLKNNYLDASEMREKVGADLFRQFGLASPQTAFCVVYVDYGSGPQYYGVYTIVEEVDDSVIKTQFADGSGNLYKPDGDAASFASGSYDTSEMELKTNEDSANYSDVRALYDIINSSERTSDVEAWKTKLEAVFNVDVFLKYLAANNIIQNWDTYGLMTHNYYLYNNPDNSMLTWIPWDNNEAFQTGKNGGALSLGMSEVSSSWPLIKYIIAQPEYEAIYEGYLQQFIDEVFVPADIISTYSTYYDLIKEYVYAEVSGYSFLSNDSQFDSAVETLKTHVQTRNNLVESYLN